MRQELLGANRTYSATAPLIPLCGACGLYKTCSSPKMKPSGKYRDKILFVGESPGQEEDFNVSDDYLQVAREIQEWNRANHVDKQPRLAV